MNKCLFFFRNQILNSKPKPKSGQVLFQNQTSFQPHIEFETKPKSGQVFQLPFSFDRIKKWARGFFLFLFLFLKIIIIFKHGNQKGTEGRTMVRNWRSVTDGWKTGRAGEFCREEEKKGGAESTTDVSAPERNYGDGTGEGDHRNHDDGGICPNPPRKGREDAAAMRSCWIWKEQKENIRKKKSCKWEKINRKKRSFLKSVRPAKRVL